MSSMTDYQKWLHSLKPGDQAAGAKKYRFHHATPMIFTVERVTKTQIIMTNTARFRRDTGDAIPYNYSSKLRVVDDEVRREITDAEELSEMARILMKRACDFTPEQRRAIIAVMSEDADQTPASPTIDTLGSFNKGYLRGLHAAMVFSVGVQSNLAKRTCTNPEEVIRQSMGVHTLSAVHSGLIRLENAAFDAPYTSIPDDISEELLSSLRGIAPEKQSNT